MKEYEIHTTVTYTTEGGTTENSYFVEYVTAKSVAEAKRISRCRAILQTGCFTRL